MNQNQNHPAKPESVSECRIYVACLASYVAGKLHGAWLTVDPSDEGADELGDEISHVLQTSPEEGAEEWAVHDYDGPLGQLAPVLGEYPDLPELVELVGLIDAHGPLVVVVHGHCDHDLARTGAALGTLSGPYEDRAEWAYQYMQDTGELSEIPERLQSYFRFSAYGHDLLMDYVEFRIDYDTERSTGIAMGLYVFDPDA